MKLRSIEEVLNLKGLRVLLRTDFNVQISGNSILDTERIKRTYQTIDFLKKRGAKVIILSHLGRPDGKKDQKYTLKPVADFLKKKYPKMNFVSDCIGPKVKSAVGKMKDGDVIMLENVRFYPGEEKNDKKFASELAKNADLYVNDAFGVSHRAHASVSAITKLLPSCAGLNLLAEVENILSVMTSFKRPATAIIGGVKISTKISVIKKFLSRFEKVLVGGALANNFFMIEGYPIGKSIYENQYLKVARDLKSHFGPRLIIPLDVVISYDLKSPKDVKEVELKDLSKQKLGFYIVDIGSKTIKLFSSLVSHSNTVVWNGPMGLFEIPKFAKGTWGVARLFAARVKGLPYGLAGGGETVAAINRLKLHKLIDFVSTGGGAMLELLEFGTLPGLEPLRTKKKE